MKGFEWGIPTVFYLLIFFLAFKPIIYSAVKCENDRLMSRVAHKMPFSIIFCNLPHMQEHI
jgi:hypothetical protein